MVLMVVAWKPFARTKNQRSAAFVENEHAPHDPLLPASVKNVDCRMVQQERPGATWSHLAMQSKTLRAHLRLVSSTNPMY